MHRPCSTLIALHPSMARAVQSNVHRQKKQMPNRAMPRDGLFRQIGQRLSLTIAAGHTHRFTRMKISVALCGFLVIQILPACSIGQKTTHNSSGHLIFYWTISSSPEELSNRLAWAEYSIAWQNEFSNHKPCIVKLKTVLAFRLHTN